ncbi:MAG: hypothetical protein IJD60_05710 [Clostridia bacterium]|nr:hypothetical protein [Clostridia bacterium]
MGYLLAYFDTHLRVQAFPAAALRRQRCAGLHAIGISDEMRISSGGKKAAQIPTRYSKLVLISDAVCLFLTISLIKL